MSQYSACSEIPFHSCFFKRAIQNIRYHSSHFPLVISKFAKSIFCAKIKQMQYGSIFMMYRPLHTPFSMPFESIILSFGKSLMSHFSHLIPYIFATFVSKTVIKFFGQYIQYFPVIRQITFHKRLR